MHMTGKFDTRASHSEPLVPMLLRHPGGVGTPSDHFADRNDRSTMPVEANVSSLPHFIAGTVAGVSEAFFVHPLDTYKVCQ